MALFGRKALSARQEMAIEKTLDSVRAQRRSRFRILACVKDEEDDFDPVRTAAKLAPGDDCDIIAVYVRPIDQGLWSGGLQLRLARQNMMDAGLELPGVRLLKKCLGVLKEVGIPAEDWPRQAGHQDAWGDPAGDNKIEYKSETGRGVVLKLKTAPDPASGILDQYELGPYNLIVLGEPSRWRAGLKSWFGTGVVQRVTTLASCSVLVARQSLDKKGFFICTNGTARSMQAVRRSAVLAHSIGEPITLFSVAPDEASQKKAEENVKNARALLKAIGIKVRKGMTAVGDPTRCIIEHGSDHMVIVVSDEGRSGLRRALRPSVAFGVIKGAKTSVLDVR